jgi:hypothetical protein
MIWRIIGALIVAAMVVTAIKIAIILLIVAGLIFRTKETLGLLLVLGVLSLITHFPWVFVGILGVAGIVAIYRAVRKPKLLPPPSHTIEPEG